MTIPASTVPAVKAFLAAAIATQVADTTVAVSNGEPPPQNVALDTIFVGDVHRDLLPGAVVGSGGAGWLEERYTVFVTTQVYRGDADAVTADTRAYLLAFAVEAAVRNDPSLGGLVQEARPVSSVEYTEWVPPIQTTRSAGRGVGAKSRVVKITTGVLCQVLI